MEGLPSREGGVTNFPGMEGTDGTGGAPALKSVGSCVNLVEYLLFTKSAVLAPCCGLSRGISRLALSASGRVGAFWDDRVAAANPEGSGALICLGALIFGRTVRFLRSDIPLLFSSDIFPASCRIRSYRSFRVCVVAQPTSCRSRSCYGEASSGAGCSATDRSSQILASPSANIIPSSRFT